MMGSRQRKQQQRRRLYLPSLREQGVAADTHGFMEMVLTATQTTLVKRQQGGSETHDVFLATKLNLSVTSQRTNTPLKSQ